MTRRLAVVGSGPAGCFAVDALLRKIPGARIDVFERLPSPYGLVRGGVAPDHPGTKAIIRQFERLFLKDEVRFFGNVAIGADIALDELRGLYDAVVIATGAPADRRLDIPGGERAYGAGALVGWYNGHPDHSGLSPRIAERVAIIGNGNVALDVARILAKTPAELAASDMPAQAAAALAAARVREIFVIGRRGPAETSFSPAELSELGRLENAAPVVEAVTGEGRIPDILRGFAAAPAKPVAIRFLFHWAPAEVTADGLRLERAGAALTLPVGTVITAIGFVPAPPPAGPFLYATGWARRGARGTIPVNRADAFEVADSVAADLQHAPPSPAGEVAELLSARGVAFVDFAGWRRIDAAETARAAPPKPREKFTTIVEMVACAHSGRSAPFR